MGQQKVNGKVYLDLREAHCVEFSGKSGKLHKTPIMDIMTPQNDTF